MIDPATLWALEALAREEWVRGGGDDRQHGSAPPADLGGGGDDCVACGARARVRRDDASGWSGVCVECGVVERAGHLVVGGEQQPPSRYLDHRSARDCAGSDSRSHVDGLLPRSTMGTRFRPGDGPRRRGPWARYARVVHDRTRMPYLERSRYKTFREIDRVMDALVRAEEEYTTSDDRGHGVATSHHRETRAHAHALYARLHDTRHSRGMVRKALTASCVYRAWMDFNAPRTVREVAKAAGISAKRLARAHKTLARVIRPDVSRVANEPVRGQCMTARCCARLVGTGALTTADARRLGREAARVLNHLKVDETPELCGRAPTSMTAGAILYAAKRLGPSSVACPGAVAEVTGVSVVTVNKIYRLLETHLPST